MARPANWTHNRDHFYKYMSATTAKEVLRKRTLRWSSPLLFNDPFDIQFDLHVEYERDRVVRAAMEEIWLGYSGAKPIAQGNLVGSALALLREMVPNLTRAELERELLAGIVEGIEKAEARLPQMHAEMRAAIADLRVLSFSEIFDNILMWAHYAQDHTVAVLRFTCVEEFDSAWGAAKPVKYQSAMPRLLNETQTVSLMSGQTQLDTTSVFENAVLTKAIDWSYEKEWRLIGGWNPNTDYEDIGFHPKEFTALYLGCRIRSEDRDELIAVVRESYPHALIFAGRKSDRDFGLAFTLIR